MTAPTGPGGLDDEALIAEAERHAEQILKDAAALETRGDRRRRRQIAAMVADGASRDFLIELTDQVLRIRSPRRAAERLRDLVGEHGAPAFARPADRLALRLGVQLSKVAAGVVMPLITARLRRELSGIVLPAERRRLSMHLRRRRSQGIRCNVNLLGEAVLGDGEAKARADALVELLRRREIDYVSVKISSICARIDVLAYEDSLERIVERLRPIYLEAARQRPQKFVNLDMEEYRDLELTIDAFTRLLDEPELAGLDAGIVLQAYLPDSVPALERLAAFARKRHARSGATVKVRIVKGANLAMERVEAELRGWEQAPFATKEETDANYKRLLEMALAPENDPAVRVGVASHNLFDVGWALARRRAGGAEGRVELEMLEGMANPQALATARLGGGLLLYVPIVRRGDFESAVAYLVRRFDENTAPENFLAHLFALEPGSPQWEEQRRRFEEAVRARHEPVAGRRRTQDRSSEERAPAALGPDAPFDNEADTDFSLPENRAWVASHLAGWKDDLPEVVPAIVDGQAILAPASGSGIDPGEPSSTLYRYVEADLATVDRAVELAGSAARRWRQLGAEKRRSILRSVAEVMARQRGRSIAVMAHDAGRPVAEADVEVSEAIDFARYYGDQALFLERPGDGGFEPYGVTVVAPPWNFPYSIPAGGVLASLAAGSAVVLKPAPESVLTAWLLAEQCHEAGVPTDVLQFLPCRDDEGASHLVKHPGVDAVILTGSYETARLLLGMRGDLELHAETSGKNAIVITAAADLDDAIRDLVRSAFGGAGQKCSAASFAVVEASVYDDGRFLERLADAVRTLRVGKATDLATEVPPLIRPPAGRLRRGLEQLEPGERWLVRPSQVGDDPHLWSPGVKLGVRPGSELHLEECFGPLLGILRAENLEQSIALENAPEFGLTGGLQSLDSREIERWLEQVEVGNAYVNRHITGAIVRRQPFGGWKRSSVGATAKTGGPLYLPSLGAAGQKANEDGEAAIEAALGEWERLSGGEDPSGLLSEENVLRLRALPRLGVRSRDGSDGSTIVLLSTLCSRLGVDLDVSLAKADPELAATVESDDAYLRRIAAGPPRRLLIDRSAGELRLALMDAGLDVEVADLTRTPAEMLRHLVREQAVSRTRHRHGMVTTRKG